MVTLHTACALLPWRQDNSAMIQTLIIANKFMHDVVYRHLQNIGLFLEGCGGGEFLFYFLHIQQTVTKITGSTKSVKWNVHISSTCIGKWRSYMLDHYTREKNSKKYF